MFKNGEPDGDPVGSDVGLCLEWLKNPGNREVREVDFTGNTVRVLTRAECEKRRNPLLK
jgi:hypothetical protein